MTEELMRVGISLPSDLLEQFDMYIEKHGYTNRSEAVRDLIRRELNKETLSSKKEVFGTLTMLYDHHQTALSDNIMEIQHNHLKNVMATTHVHIDHDNCLEVVLIRGTSQDIEDISNRILALKGVKLGKVVMVGKDIP